MFKNEDLVESSSSDEEATPTPNKKKLLNTMAVIPGQSSSRYPIWYWRPEDQEFSMEKQYDKEPDNKKYVEIVIEGSPVQCYNETGQDLQKNWSIGTSSVLKRAHHADPTDNSADLRKKFVDKQTENSSLDEEKKNNSENVEDTQSTSETEETDSEISDVSTVVLDTIELDTENIQSQPIDVIRTENSSYSENESSVCSDCHDMSQKKQIKK